MPSTMSASPSPKKGKGFGPTRPSPQDLRRHINRALNGQSRKQCQFSDEELFLLAFAYNAEQWLSPKDVGRFIMTKVKYYQTLAADYHFDNKFSYELQTLNRSMEKYLSTYNTPIHRKFNAKLQKVYSISAGSGHFFLQRLGVVANDRLSTFDDTKIKSDDIPFPLMHLPSELRRQIYNLVLHCTGYRLKVLKKGFVGYEDNVAVWNTPDSMGKLIMPTPSEMLSLISVNKEIKSEAMPEFYMMNHFHFEDLGILKAFLSGIGPERRKYMANITISWSNMVAAPTAAKLLVESDLLHRLTMIMVVTHDPAGHFNLRGYSRKYKTLDSIPGLRTLRKLRGVRELTIYPPIVSKLIDDHLRPHVTKARHQPRVKKGTKCQSTKKQKKPTKGHHTSNKARVVEVSDEE